MKSPVKYFLSLVFLLSGIFVLSSFLSADHRVKAGFVFPYKKAGLTERQAAAHLLSRFTYGPTPGEIDGVIKIGLEKWFEQQLDGNMPDDSLNTLLAPYDAMKMSNTQIANIYPRGGQALRMAIRDGVINKDSAREDRKEYRNELNAYMAQKGLKPMQELYRQLYNQKVMRAAYSQNQLREVLTEFWLNHFNVSTTKGDAAEFIPAYERDVIRPNVTGKFGDLLLATAKSPAMLYYLDNFSSSGASGNQDNNKQFLARMKVMEEQAATNPMMADMMQKVIKGKKNSGLNENYAREVMELHTLGVDGGYTQEDVTQAAKILTGWTVYPMSEYGGGNGMMQQLARIGDNNEKLKARGYYHDGDFLFTPNRHDNSDKVVMGHKFVSNGYQEGVDLLNLLAHHDATAKFITRKLAVRFVNDNPQKSLLDKMTKAYKNEDGDIRKVLVTMASSPEFWSPSAVREKTKSPFELVISSVRSLNAKISQPYQLYSWANKMGQRLYGYQAPTGYPDKGQYWINTGALLNRMNFGLALASDRIPGVKIDLAALNKHREPESAEAALLTYSKLVMPERDVAATVKQLTPMLNDPNLGQKVAEAASKTPPPAPMPTPQSDMMMNGGQDMMATGAEPKEPRKNFGRKNGYQAQASAKGNNTMLAQVVGIIVGSPEFQRR